MTSLYQCYTNVLVWDMTYSFCHKLKGRSYRYFSCNDVARELCKFAKLGETWFYSSAESLIFGRTLNSDYLPILPLQLPKGSFARPNSIQSDCEPSKFGNSEEFERRSNIECVISVLLPDITDCSFYPDTTERDFTLSFTLSPFLWQHFHFSVSSPRNFIQRFTFISSSRTSHFQHWEGRKLYIHPTFVLLWFYSVWVPNWKES